jgi:hypothetical protein
MREKKEGIESDRRDERREEKNERSRGSGCSTPSNLQDEEYK